VILGSMDMDMVHMEVVVLGGNSIGIGVGKGWGNMEVNSVKGLVSMVVRSYVEEVVHWHMIGLVGNYKGVHHIYHLGMHLGMALYHSNLVEVVFHEGVHHNYCLGMHCRMVVVHGILESVVAERVDQILVAPSIRDCFDLDACSCYSSHSFQ